MVPASYFGLIAHPVELDLAPEYPVDADGVGQHDGDTDEGDGEHDVQGFSRGGRVVGGEAELRVGQAYIFSILAAVYIAAATRTRKPKPEPVPAL